MFPTHAAMKTAPWMLGPWIGSYVSILRLDLGVGVVAGS